MRSEPSHDATTHSKPIDGAIEKEGSVQLSESCRSFVSHDRQFMAVSGLLGSPCHSQREPTAQLARLSKLHTGQPVESVPKMLGREHYRIHVFVSPDYIEGSDGDREGAQRQ